MEPAFGAPSPLHAEDAAPRRLTVADTAIAILLSLGYGAPLIGFLMFGMAAVGGGLGGFAFAAAPFGLALMIGLVFWIRSLIARRGRRTFQIAAEVLALVILPAWGMAYSHGGNATCEVDNCGGPDTFRALAEPEVYGLLALHALGVVAYVVSRRRPEALFPPIELLVDGILLFAMTAMVLVAVHFGPWLVAGVVAAPLLIPCLTPVLVFIFYLVEVRGRLVRRGLEARLPREKPIESIYREGGEEDELGVPERIHGPTFVRALAVSTGLAGVYAVIHAAWLGNPAGAVQVLTRTCGYTLSRVEIVTLPADCHYLCTVAARGHSSLVRPLRVGRRGGIPILVNRQLAVANAFEDLLHERVPRFGRFARQVYDRLGLPVSRLIRSPWAADLVFIAMKPAEWLFFLVLLIFDRRSPEERIDRMYR